ncbi:DUF523 domain-containing protein [Natranaerobius thermophilus]|nr:DUF523 domain-containing protein [Natranaerobius thermophilus]
MRIKKKVREISMYVVSACLAGINCRFDGKNCYDERVADLVKSGEAIPLCPEVLGGLSIPRTRCEMTTEEGELSVISETGEDRTQEYTLGAEKTVDIAKTIGASQAIMKEESPSCGLRRIYDGSFSNKKITGTGISSKLLLNAGVKVMTEEDL